jgi:hypothetical protein
MAGLQAILFGHMTAYGLSQQQWAVRGSLRERWVGLLLQNRFNLADFLLDFSGKFFALAIGCQPGIVRQLSRFLLGLAFQLMQLALDLIVRARFHLFVSCFP